MPVRPIPAGSPASGTTATTTTSFCWRRPASALRTPPCLTTRCPPQSSSPACPRQTRACCPLAGSRRGTRAPLPPPPPDVPAPRASRPLRCRVAEQRDPSTRLRSGKRMPREDSWLHRWRFTTRRFSMLRKNALTLSLLLVVVVPILLLGAGSVRADEDQRGAVKLLATVPVPTTDRGATLVPLRAFDISWVDAATQLYYLGDRSNKSVDVVDARTNTFLRHITGGFKGVVFKANNTADNDKSGPNGVVVSGRFLFVTDAPSRVVTVDLRTDQIVLGGDVSTGGTDGNRADELAFDPQDRLLLVVNNADDPPFASLIKVNADGALTVNQNECSTSVHPPCRITFKNFGPNGDTATNGAEQPVWEPKTRRFYISILFIDAATTDGAVAKINPH